MSAEGAASDAYRRAAWSWTQHLRSGGCTPWSAWSAWAGEGSPAPDGWSVPGAAQLELVRRLALPGRLDTSGSTALADLVLGRSAPGRGLAQQPLTWPGGAGATPFGAPPVDPADVPVEELLRAGAGVLTELLLAAPGPGTARRSPGPLRRRLLRGGPAFVLAGPPVTTSVVRRALAADGHTEGGRTPRVVLLVEPFDVLLGQAWSARVQSGAAVRWRGFVQRWAGRRELPPSADLPAAARRWADRVGAGRVHVVVAGPDPVATVSRVRQALGMRPRARGLVEEVCRPADLPPAGVDLVRRVNAVLNVRVPREGRSAARRTLVALLGRCATPAPPLTVPPAYRGWAQRRSGDLVEQLTAGGYSVHGDLAAAVPGVADRAVAPRAGDVLDLLVDVTLTQTELNRHPAPEGTRP